MPWTAYIAWDRLSNEVRRCCCCQVRPEYILYIAWSAGLLPRNVPMPCTANGANGAGIIEWDRSATLLIKLIRSLDKGSCEWPEGGAICRYGPRQTVHCVVRAGFASKRGHAFYYIAWNRSATPTATVNPQGVGLLPGLARIHMVCIVWSARRLPINVPTPSTQCVRVILAVYMCNKTPIKATYVSMFHICRQATTFNHTTCT